MLTNMRFQTSCTALEYRLLKLETFSLRQTFKSFLDFQSSLTVNMIHSKYHISGVKALRAVCLTCLQGIIK